MSKLHLQQWQQYNPLDKSTVLPNVPKSNKLTYAKNDAGVSHDTLMQPKVGLTGVCPARSSMEIENLKVMMVGSSTFDLPSTAKVKGHINEHEKKVEAKSSVVKPTNKQERLKMPAIINTEGTTTRAPFVRRAKPPSMPRSKIKVKQKPRPNAPPNSPKGSNFKHTLSSSSFKEVLSEGKLDTSTSATSPTNEGTVVSVEITEATTTPVRSIDDMIQTLRSSRQASGSHKSMSDVKIDEILQQVMSHAKEWMEEEAPTVEPQASFSLFEEEIQTSDAEEVEKKDEDVEAEDEDENQEVTIEIDISDTVSTLASQISATAGIPDCSSILMRKSSHALRGGSSQFSATSSPAAMMQDEEEALDYEQAVQDLHQTLDVRNDDIISIQGGIPPLIEKPAKPSSSDDEGIGSESSSEKPIPFFPTGGRIHRLCLLPAIDEISITPREYALSKVTHAGNFTNQGDSSILAQQVQKDTRRPQFTYESSPEFSTNDKNIEKKIEANHLDSSKLDPLDIDGWKRLVEHEMERKDYTLCGTNVQTKEWGLWRMLWTTAPPKMALSTSAVKALVFPKYHGTISTIEVGSHSQLAKTEEQMTVMSLEEEEKTEFNIRTLFKRHKSLSDLTQETEEKPLKKNSSIPNLAIHTEDRAHLPSMVRTSYTTAMAEVKKQKELVLDQHKKDHMKDDSDHQLSDRSREAVNISQATIVTHAKTEQPLVSGGKEIPATDKTSQLSLAAQAREAGRDYVVYSKRNLRSKHSKRFVLSARKSLTSYIPLHLIRSRSVDSFITDPVFQAISRVGRGKTKTGCLPKGKLTRTRSIPRFMEFDWFIGRHQKYSEPIEDVREWVRDIWNTWFDELFPATSSEESSYYSEDESDDVIESREERGDVVKREHKNVPVPDTIPPAITVTSEEIEEPEEMMRSEVERLTDDLHHLPEEQVAKKACHLSRRGTLLRKLGEIKMANEDLNEAISIEPRLVQAYWQRHLIKLLHNQQHEALDDLNTLLKIDKLNVDAYRSRADIFASLGDYTMSIVNYSQAIKLDPENEETYFQRAQKFEKTGDMLLAMEDYGNVVRLNPTRTDALLRRAKFYFKKKSWHSAVNDFTQLIEKEPLNSHARSYRGRAYAAMGQSENALVDLSAAIHLDPTNAAAFFHRGSLLRTAAPDRALQDLSISFLLDDTEQNVLALLHRGILYSELKKYQEAMADFEQTLRLDHSMACAHVNIGLIHLQVTDNYWEAIRRFTFAIKGDPTYTRSYVCRSDAFARINDYQSAVRDITRAIHLQPTERHLYLRRGKLLLQLRKLKLAAFCVRHIATLEKGFVSTSPTQQAVVQSFLGNHTAAVESLSSACRLKPKPHMYVLLSKTLMKGKRYKEAITNLKNALELSTLYTYGATTSTANEAPPEAAEIHFLLGQCYTEQLQHTEALQAYNQALKVNPELAEAYYQRGLCRLKLDHSKGIQDLNRALALQPLLFEAYLSRAAYYSTKERYSKAILNCNEALRLRPKSVRALLCRGGLKFRISAYRHALTDLSAAIELDKQCSFAYYNRAVVLQAMERYPQALMDYSIVLVLTDADKNSDSKSLRLRVFVNRALLYLKSNLRDARNAALDLEEATLLNPKDTYLTEAYNSYTRCLDVDPYFLTAYVGRGDVFADAGQHDNAQGEYQRVLKLDPSNVDARVHLGYSLQVCGHLQQAWNQFTAAIELDPKSQSALEGRAVTCLHAGNSDAALKDVNLALRSGPPSARLLTACGVVHQSMSDLHTAMAYYNKARSLDPTYIPGVFNCAVLYMRNRQFSEAAECLDLVLDENPDDTAALLNRAIAHIFLKKTEV
nr:uncharacterized protein LOC100175887 [Ciona intestinalis]|eukprot:XP_009860033.2 uncharacterized protein LOC100175887 [Ciona intestinalis]